MLACWASLGQLTFAEPGALVGFLGPKVFAALQGRAFPSEVQTAENLRSHGLVDAVLTPAELRRTTARFLSLLVRRPAPPPPPPATRRSPAPSDAAWPPVTATRRADRPGAADLIRQAADVVALTGCGEGGTDDAVAPWLARFGSRPCVIIAQDRAAQLRAPLGPDGLRTARRGMRPAAPRAAGTRSGTARSPGSRVGTSSSTTRTHCAWSRGEHPTGAPAPGRSAGRRPPRRTG